MASLAVKLYYFEMRGCKMTVKVNFQVNVKRDKVLYVDVREHNNILNLIL